MAWVRLDDKRALNAKLRAAGFAARGLDEAAMCWTCHELNDGFISDGDVEMLAHAHGCRKPAPLVRALVDAGRWHRNDERGGYEIHDFLDYNPSKAEQAARSAARAEAGRVGGRISRRSSKPEASALPDGQDLALTAGKARGSGRVGVTSTKQHATKLDEIFDSDFWPIYPRRESKGDARKAFAKAVKTAGLEAIVAGAKRYRDDPNRVPEYTQLPATWLNREGWESDPLPPRSSQNGNGRRPDPVGPTPSVRARLEAERRANEAAGL